MPAEESAGVGAGVAASAENYADQVAFGAHQGHGFAAERANHLADRLMGRDATIVGSDNAKNGADRIVELDGQHDLSEFVGEDGVDRVGALGPIEADMGDAVADGVGDRGELHGLIVAQGGAGTAVGMMIGYAVVTRAGRGDASRSGHHGRRPAGRR